MCYDVKLLLEKEVFDVFRINKIFMDACIIMNDTLVWDVSENRDVSKCIDTVPDILHELDAVKENIV